MLKYLHSNEPEDGKAIYISTLKEDHWSWKSPNIRRTERVVNVSYIGGNTVVHICRDTHEILAVTIIAIITLNRELCSYSCLICLDLIVMNLHLFMPLTSQIHLPSIISIYP